MPLLSRLGGASPREIVYVRVSELGSFMSRNLMGTTTATEVHTVGVKVRERKVYIVDCPAMRELETNEPFAVLID